MISEEGKLYLIPTPIGNLGDITFRAVELLRSVDLVLAEDTRHTGKLLQHLGIETRLSSFHQHNEHQKVDGVIRRIQEGASIAYCSDAGTPGISDPGFLLVRACVEAEVRVECLPGPTAFVPSLVASGLPCDRFVFEGFLPPKKGRTRRLEELANETRTMIFYESPYKLLKTIDQLIGLFGEDRQFCIARELSKLHEEFIRGSGAELRMKIQKVTLKGEFVIIAEGKK
ncbi:MAG: 16S rRNA (cytidine(1402)-2'-O)-methyltransferase [Flavobacteriales bacterium]|nr:16S rRNA (cytidine(1402)-2'-O)-methyltransferase [Flavobacteriales bacterium]